MVTDIFRDKVFDFIFENYYESCDFVAGTNIFPFIETILEFNNRWIKKLFDTYPFKEIKSKFNF